MRRVVGQEHPPRSVPLGDPLGRVPGRTTGDGDVQVRHAHRATDVLGAPLVGELLERLAVFGVPGSVEHPVLAVVHRQQRPVGVGAGEVADDEAAVADHVGEAAGGEGDADVVEQVAGAVVADAELLPDRAAGAVRGDQVVRPDGGVLAGLPALDQRRHAVAVVVERHHLGAVAQVAAQLAGAAQQHRLEVVLAAQAPGGGAEAGQAAAGVDLPEQPLARVPHEGRRLQDAVVVLQDRRGLDDALLRMRRCGTAPSCGRCCRARADGSRCPRAARRACAARRAAPGTETSTGPPGAPTMRTGVRWTASPVVPDQFIETPPAFARVVVEDGTLLSSPVRGPSRPRGTRMARGSPACAVSLARSRGRPDHRHMATPAHRTRRSFPDLP